MADKNRYTDEELEEFKSIIMKKIESARSDYELLRKTISHESSNDTEDTSALIRIENKTYGICRETGKLIAKDRLRAVPHATLCIEAKQGQK